MTKTPPRFTLARLALIGGALLALAGWLAVEVHRALALVAASAGVPTVRALDLQTVLKTLQLNQELAHALPMLTIGAAALVLVLLALAATAWRRLRKPLRAAGPATGPVVAPTSLEAPAASPELATASETLQPGQGLRSGLLSRDEFLAHHQAAVAQAAQHKQRVAVLCFELERQPATHAILGFDAGDEALAQTAHRARAYLGTGGTLAQLGGSTLAALVRLEGSQTALHRAQALRVALQQSRLWRGQCLELGVTVGAAASPEHGETTAELLRRAEQAMFEAQRVGSVVATYHPAIEAARLAHLDMALRLHEALERNELVPHLQPHWCTRSRRVVGAELLLRWQHPARGCLLPAEFLPFAESTGRMPRITQQLLLKTAKLLQTELATLHLSVNLSAADLREPGLTPLLQQLLQAHGLAPHHLVLEVTETALLAGGAEARARLAEWRALGMRVAIDDFGTGPAPLAQLPQLPASELKLHPSYTADVDHSPGRQQLLRSIIDMAHSLNLTVTAKGVETEGEREVLEKLGCDHLQGYLLGRPMPVQDFLALVQGSAPPPLQPASMSAQMLSAQLSA